MKKIIKILSLSVPLVLAGCGGDNGVVTPVVNQARILAITPNTASLGAQGQPVEITGSGFVSVTAVDLGAGINIVSRNVPDSGRIQLVIGVAGNAASGPRTVVVSTATSTATMTAGFTVSSNRAPVAKFTVSPTQGTISSTFVFDASSSEDKDGTITAYKWQISDGSSPKGMKVQHQFSQKGDYTVALTVSDSKGGVSTTQKSVTVGDNLPPIATFTVTPTKGTNLTLFEFDASGSSDPDGSVKSYKWDFGDNKTDQGMRVTHKFSQAGDYLVQLTVTDSKNAQTIAKKTIPVTFFDVEKAKKEITDTITNFLRLFGHLTSLSAEEIVVGFSKSPSCTGRYHEINIIETEQGNVRSSGVRNISVVVNGVNDLAGLAAASAEFYGVTNSGQSYDGYATHHFTMVNENGAWMMCNFSVTPGASAPAQ